MSLSNHRILFTLSNNRLRRARILYIFLCRRAWLNDPNGAMSRMSHRMANSGLYAPATSKYPRDLRYRICRYLWKLTPGYDDMWGWSRWCNHNGLDSNFKRINKKTA